MGIRTFIEKLIGLFTVPRCPNCGARLEEVPREEEMTQLLLNVLTVVKNGVRNRIKNNLIRCPCY